MEIVYDLCESRFFCGRPDGSNVGQRQQSKSALEQIADARLVEHCEFTIHDATMDFFNGLMDKQSEEDHRRPGRGEIIFAKEFILAWASLVHFQITSKTVASFDRHPLLDLESLRRQ